MSNVFDVRTCRVCGCTDDNACPPTCWWVAEDLCSTCDSIETPHWSGMPDPHRHNPLAVALILALFGVLWFAIGAGVVALIFGAL
jgi:hypothetical protein